MYGSRIPVATITAMPPDGTPTTKRATILDVAAAAGVSRQTVTRAMNDMGHINAVTKQRVLDVSARLGYRPSRFARSLVVRHKTRALGLIVASFRNPYFTEIAGDMLTAAAARGWQVVIASSESGDEIGALRLLSNQVDVFVGHIALPEAELIEIVGGIPVVLLESPCTLPGVHCVEVDIRAAMQDAIEQLRRKGARTIGMIDSGYSLRFSSTYVPSPRRGYFEELAGGDLDGAIVVGEESMAGGGRAFTELMQARPDIDTVLVFNDVMAIGAVQASHVLGIAVPQQVRIVGIDGLALGEAVTPTLTTLSIDRQALVSNALDIVDELDAAHFAKTASIRRVTLPRMLWRESA